MNARPTATTRNTGSAAESLLDTSMFEAVVPPTRILAPELPATVPRSFRIPLTRSVVALSLRPVLGVTRMTATPLSTAIGAAATTPGILARRSVIGVTSEAFATGSATTRSATGHRAAARSGGHSGDPGARTGRPGGAAKPTLTNHARSDPYERTHFGSDAMMRRSTSATASAC